MASSFSWFVIVTRRFPFPEEVYVILCFTSDPSVARVVKDIAPFSLVENFTIFPDFFKIFSFFNSRGVTFTRLLDYRKCNFPI